MPRPEASPTLSPFDPVPGRRLIVTGAGAAARGAFEAGIGLVTTYPGSPITETFEILASSENTARPICSLSLNEHVAFHKAMGFSLAGGRSLITMKHVGFNVAADPAHYIGYTGVKGGMVILVGTDPGAQCSTGEYDFRFYALHTHLPLVEPTSGQQILDCMRHAFEWSEADGVPYVIAVPAGACYGIEGVVTGMIEPKHAGTSFTESKTLTNVGRRAVENHRKLLERLEKIRREAEIRNLVQVFGNGREALIITSGIHLSRVREAANILGIAERLRIFCSTVTHPFPTDLLKTHVEACSRLIFVEDLGGFLETVISRYLLSLTRSPHVQGKDLFPAYGNLDLDMIMKGLANAFSVNIRKSCDESHTETAGITAVPDISKIPEIPEREGTFCPGCGYRGFFHILTEFLGPDDIMGGDIGCSSLPPHFSSWLTCMNSGTAIAAGVSLALAGRRQIVSMIGDSTLLHSGLQTLIEAAADDSDQVCFILYNHWTAMTGHQATPATPRTAEGVSRPHIDIKSLLTVLGVKRFDTIDPWRISGLRVLLKRVLHERGFRVVIVERECTLLSNRRRPASGWHRTYRLEPERCHECGMCYERLSCPAIVKNADGVLAIENGLCAHCGVCEQICPNGAIQEIQIRK
ncbi:MAG: indolepyruvate ferredoxin oxidoreductase subunit alpha [Candidatus Riflebacteria bacterium]|nr:indolepyruvate ferredoxin oxidoreductase subunit alpha [Candidatus Riflebacteria bacterium]